MCLASRHSGHRSTCECTDQLHSGASRKGTGCCRTRAGPALPFTFTLRYPSGAKLYPLVTIQNKNSVKNIRIVPVMLVPVTDYQAWARRGHADTDKVTGQESSRALGVVTTICHLSSSWEANRNVRVFLPVFPKSQRH